MNKAIILKWNVDNTTMRVSQDIKITNAPEKEADNLDFFYKHIECTAIDVVMMNGCDIFVNDNGLLESDNVVAEYRQDDGVEVPLAGNLVITKGIDSIGRTVWFDEDDYRPMMKIIMMLERAKLKGVTA